MTETNCGKLTKREISLLKEQSKLFFDKITVPYVKAKLKEQAKQIFEDIENHYYSDVFSKDQPTLTELKFKWVKE